MGRYFIYKMYDYNDDVIYVGRTTNIKMRMLQHFGCNAEHWKKDVSYIKAASCKSYYDMCIYEVYYIGKLKPKHNKVYMQDGRVTVNIEELRFVDYKNLAETNIEINKDLIKKYVKIYGDENTKMNRNVGEFEMSAFSDRWYSKPENRNDVEQVFKNANNFSQNLLKEFQFPSISFPKDVLFNNYNTKLRGLTRIINKYENMKFEEYSKLNKLVYLRNTYGNTKNKKCQNKHGLEHFLKFVSKSAIVNEEQVIVYCPSCRIRELFYEYINN